MRNSHFQIISDTNIPGSIWGFLAASSAVSEPAALKTTGPRETVALALGSSKFAYKERPAALGADPGVESGMLCLYLRVLEVAQDS